MIVQSINRQLYLRHLNLSQVLLASTSKNEWVSDSGCTHHIAKDASLLSSLDVAAENKIYVVDDFALDIVGCGDIYYRHDQIIDVCHVPSPTANILSIYQLT